MKSVHQWQGTHIQGAEAENATKMVNRIRLEGPVDFLSIGSRMNAFWTLDKICRSLSHSEYWPRIIAVRINAELGANESLTVEFSEDPTANAQHFGASALAFALRGDKCGGAGYEMVHCSSEANEIETCLLVHDLRHS